MPSSPSGSASRASSPLSSASSSALSDRPFDEQIGEASRRSERSPTSSTVGLLPSESELTEEEADEMEGREDHRDDHRDISMPDSLSGADQSTNDDELPVAPHTAHRNRIISSVNTPSPASRASRSPSLTPPPESTRVNSTDLPPISPASGSRKRTESPLGFESGEGGESEEEYDERHDDEADVIRIKNALSAWNVESLASKAPTENNPSVDDQGEDGDVTVRPVEPDKLDPDSPELIEAGTLAVEDEEEGMDPGAEDEIEEHAVAGPSVVMEQEEAASTPILAPIRPHSSHAPPPPPAAMRSLLELELKFAALRDKLYLERMEEAAAEEEMLLNGTHPALRYIYQTLSERRVRLHEVASRRHYAVVEELKRVREAEKSHVWTWWTEQRDQVHWEEFAETWSKRRRLAREKTEIETPRMPRPIPRAGGPRFFKPFDWCTGARPSKLGAEEAANDLAIMENRRVIHPLRTSNPLILGPAPTTSYATGPSQPVPPPSTSYWTATGRATPSMNATLDRQTITASTGPSQPRREGRTVPTISDVFDGPRKREREAEASASTPGLWNGKTNEPSTLAANGHDSTATKDAVPAGTATTVTNTTSASAAPGAKAASAWMGTGFPSLTTFMDRPSHPNGGAQNAAKKNDPPNYSGLFGLGTKANTVLSPPRSTGILSATPAGTQAARP